MAGAVRGALVGVAVLGLVAVAVACSADTGGDRSDSQVVASDVVRACVLRVCREFPWVARGTEMGDQDRLHVERTEAFRTLGLRSREARGVMAKGGFRRLVFFVPGRSGTCLYVADQIDGGLISCEPNADAVGRGLAIEFLEPPAEEDGAPVHWVIRADPLQPRPLAKVKATATAPGGREAG